jgi:hypothetical protein
MNGALCDVMHSGNRFDGFPFQPTAEAIFMNSIPNVALARKTPLLRGFSKVITVSMLYNITAAPIPMWSFQPVVSVD